MVLQFIAPARCALPLSFPMKRWQRDGGQWQTVSLYMKN